MKTQPNTPLIFIIGRARSGTSMLQAMFDAHPNVMAPSESFFILFLYQRYKGGLLVNPENRLAFERDLEKESSMKHFWIRDEELWKKFWDKYEGTHLSYPSLCRIVYHCHTSFFSKPEVKLLVDKNPQHIHYIGRLRKLFPEAKFIHLVRDPRGNAASLLKVGYDDAAGHAYAWKRQNQLVEQWKKKIPNHFTTVRYEDLISKPSETLTALCRFGQIDYHEDMLRFGAFMKDNLERYFDEANNDTARDLRKQSMAHLHQNLSKTLDPSKAEAWKAALSEEEQNSIAKVAGRFASLQYQYDFPIEAGNRTPLIGYLKYVRWVWQVGVYFRLPFGFRARYFPPKLEFSRKGDQAKS